MQGSADAPEPAPRGGADPHQSEPRAPHTPPDAPADLGMTLSGRLPCVCCGYDLQGLSVRGNCPECGAAVRAAILFLVDPDADALRPLRRPRVAATALPLWAGAGFLAALAAWVPRMDSAARHLSGGRVSIPAEWAPWAVLLGAAISAVAATGLIHLVRGVHRRWRVAAAIGALAYLPLLALLWALYFRIDPNAPAPYTGGADHPERIGVRFGINALLMVILLGMRPNARLLVSRCLALRTGRVDRQTILATIASIGVIMLGDALRLLASQTGGAGDSLTDLAGSVLVFAGSGLLTFALAGATIDTLRIRRSILIPSPSIRQVLGRPS